MTTKKVTKEERDQAKRRLHLLLQGHLQRHTIICQNSVTIAKGNMHKDTRKSAEHLRLSATTVVS